MGDLAHNFTLALSNRQTAGMTSLREQVRPMLLYIFAKWLPAYRAELRSLKDVYPQYQDAVVFHAISVDPTEGLQILEEYRDTQGSAWPVVAAPAGMLADYSIVRHASKVAIDGTGVITFSAGYGTESSDMRHKVFRQLASQ